MTNENDLHSGLYYPYKRIREQSTLTTGLLLLDRFHIISPRPDFKVEYPADLPNRVLQEQAFAAIGKYDVPTDDQKQRAHKLIVEFCALPQVTAFRNWMGKAQTFAIQDIDSEVLSDTTWDFLEDEQLCGPEREDGDRELPKAIGQKLMCILADCCATRKGLPALGRVTDQEEFFGTMLGVIPGDEDFLQGSAIRHISVASLEIVNTDFIGLKRLIDFRSRETKADIELRRSFKIYAEQHARELSGCVTEEAWNDEISRYKKQITNSIKHLKEQLKIAYNEDLGFKMLVAPMQGTTAGWTWEGRNQNSEGVRQPTSAMVERDSSVARQDRWERYLAARDREIRSCPPAYLYEAAGQPIGLNPGFRWLRTPR